MLLGTLFLPTVLHKRNQMKHSTSWSEPYSPETETSHGTTVHVTRRGSVDIQFNNLASNHNSSVKMQKKKTNGNTNPNANTNTNANAKFRSKPSSKTMRHASHNQRWIIQRIVGGLSAPDVLAAAQVNRKWNRVVDSHFRLWHRLATFYSPKDAERIQLDVDIAAERRQLIQVLTESCDFLRGVGAPRTAVLSHMRGSSKRLAPSVKLIARLVQLLLTPWNPSPTSYDQKNHFFENIKALLHDVPATHTLLLSAHRAFASRKSMLLALPSKSLQEVLELSKRRQLLAPARVAAPYRQLCEWTRAMLNCVRAGNQWRLFVVTNFKRPVLSALRRHAGFASNSSNPKSNSNSDPNSMSFSSPPPPPPSPPPPPPESLPSQEMLAGYANANYQYAAASHNNKHNHKLSPSPSSTLRDLSFDERMQENGMDIDIHISESVEGAMLQLLSVIENGRTLYGKTTGSPSGLFDAIDRDGHGFVTRGQIKAALHRLSVDITAESFREVIELLTQEDRLAGRSNVVISKDSFTNGIVRLSWKLRPLSVMSRKASWRLAGDLAASRENNSNGSKQPPTMSRHVWQAYKPLVRELREAAKRSRHLFGHVIHRMRDYFVAIDIDGDGCITNDEFRAALKRLDMGSFMTSEEVDAVFNAIDQDGNGTIDRIEFETSMKAAMTMNEKELYRNRLEQPKEQEDQDEEKEKRGKKARRHGREKGEARTKTMERTNRSNNSSVNTRSKRISPHKNKEINNSDESPLFISATRRRSLFDHESAFVVHNSRSSVENSLVKSPPRPAMTLSHEKSPYRTTGSRTSNSRHQRPSPSEQQRQQKQQKQQKQQRQRNQSPPNNKRVHHSNPKRSNSPSRSTSPNRHQTKAKDTEGSVAQQRIYSRLQELRVEHEERLAEVEKKYNGKVKHLAHRVEKSNNSHHADLEGAMDEMDDMRQRLMQAHERRQATVNAKADEQIADLEREKMAMEAHYLEEISGLENERITLAEVVGEIPFLRKQLRQERIAYQTLEQEHAEEINHLLSERRVAEKVKTVCLLCQHSFLFLFL